jgi:hypothetical protein
VRLGVSARAVEPEEIREWYEVVDGFRRRRSLPRFSLQQLREHHVHLGDWRRDFAAYHEGRVVAVMGVLACNGVAVEVEVGATEACEKDGLPANDYLKHFVMQWAGEQGMRRYDLAGVALEPADDKERGIRRFKEKWGGDLVAFDAWSARVPFSLNLSPLPAELAPSRIAGSLA